MGGFGGFTGLLGLKGGEGGWQARWEKSGVNPGPAVGTGVLERERSRRNAQCSGEMHRYGEELRLRRQPTGACLTLRLESVGIEQD